MVGSFSTKRQGEQIDAAPRPPGRFCPSPLEGEVGSAIALLGGGSSAQRYENRLQDPIRIAERFIVPKSDHAITTRLKPECPRFAVICMLSAINFDDELRLRAKEIDNIGPKRMLATEAEAIKLLSAQTRPQPNLGICGRAAQFAR